MTGLERKMNRTVDKLIGNLKKPADNAAVMDSLARKGSDVPSDRADSETAVKAVETILDPELKSERFQRITRVGNPK